MMNFDIQPVLEAEEVILYPLKEEDFDDLYRVASDPEVWAQHPNKNRYTEPIFRIFFDGGIRSKGTFKVVDKQTGKVIGSTRIYDYNEQDDSIFIGYTFYDKTYWGKGINPLVKTMMLNYLFQYVSKVYFHIGAVNTRSQVSIGRLGAEKIAEEEVAYVGEPTRLNYLYAIHKEKWLANY